MTDKTMNTDESLKLITDMVQSTKYNIAEDKSIYLMWGYSVAFAAISNYVLQFQLGIEMAWIVWLTMPIAGIYTGIYYSRKKRSSRVKTFTDRALGAIWASFIAALFIFLFASPKIGWATIYPIFMVLYGIGTSSTGGILKFKPLVYGGYLSMLIGLVAFYVPFDIQFLLLAVAIVVSYVIPGHLLPKALNV
jgi:hypothetical protein